MSTQNHLAEAEGSALSPQHATTPKRLKRRRTQVGRLLENVESASNVGTGASDTNVDGVGSNADVMLRRNSSLGETAWADVGCAPGLQAWRLDDWKPVTDRTAATGTLRTSFCYLFLQTELLPDSTEFSYHVFYWIGPKSPPESQAGAAYKSVELQSYLWGYPTVSRIEDAGDSAFKALWPAGGPTIVEDDGPEAEGWLRPPPDDAHSVQLLLVNDLAAGVQCQPVKMSPMSLFDDSCYILDTGEVLVIWEGENCSVFERAKAGMAARRLLEERNGRGRIAYAHEEPSFFDFLGDYQVSAVPDDLSRMRGCKSHSPFFAQ